MLPSAAGAETILATVLRMGIGAGTSILRESTVHTAVDRRIDRPRRPSAVHRAAGRPDQRRADEQLKKRCNNQMGQRFL